MLEKGVDAVRRREGAKEQQASWVSFEVFQKYSLLANKYGVAEERVLEILDLSEISSPSFWAKLSEFDPPDLFGLRSRLKFAIEHLPRILKLIEQEHVEELRNPDASTPKALAGKSLITVVLVESGTEFSSPTRLVYALDAFSSLYQVVAALEGDPDTGLSVLACDSGSDKSFDFLGLAKLMEEVRKLILSIWDRRVFYRHMQVSQCIGIIAESLPVIEKIHALKQTGALGPEQAELLKRKAIEGATKFLESGALIADMERESVQSPRLLMQPETKLLTGPAQDITEPKVDGFDANSEPEDDSDLSPSEIEELERLVNKAKGSAGKKRPSRKRGV